MVVESDMPNSARKSDLKNATGVEALQFAKQNGLANLKSEIDKLDIGKLKTTAVDLNKLSDVVKNKSVKKTECDGWLKKANSI